MPEVRRSPEAADQVSEHQLTELRTLITRQVAASESQPADGVVSTAIDGVLVSSVTQSTDAIAPTSGTIFAVIAQGGKRLAIGEHVYEYLAGQYLVASLDLPITGSHWYASKTEPALGFGLVLDPPSVASLLLEAAEHGASTTRRTASSTGPPAGLGVADATVELLDAVIRMLRLVDRPNDRDVLAPLIKREILWRLIAGPVGETVRQIGLADSRLTSIGRSVRWITQNYNRSFRVDELARSSGMSTSAFHRAFHAVTGLSPIRFQKQIRLQRSRLMLMAGREDVATVAYQVGYESASQFNREYRRQFGLPPARDAQQLRAEAISPEALTRSTAA
jgi:AraC-like DNA-binding protein